MLRRAAHRGPPASTPISADSSAAADLSEGCPSLYGQRAAERCGSSAQHQGDERQERCLGRCSRRGIGGDLRRLHGLVLGGGQLCLGFGSLRLPSTGCRRSILPDTFLGAGHTVTAATAIAAIG